MAIEKVVGIKIDNDEAIKKLKKQEKATEDSAKAMEGLSDATGDQGKAAKKAANDQKNLNDEVENTGDVADKAGKKGGKGFKALSGGVNLVGKALVATGITAVFALLFKVFSENQVAVDAINKAMNFTQQVVQKLTPPVITLKDALLSYFDAIKNVGTGIFKFITGDAEGAGEAFSKAGDSFVEAGKGVVKAGQQTVDAVVDIAENAEGMWELSDAMVEMQKQMELAAVKSDILQKQYMKEAEIQRQLRDDVSASISDRIAANEELGKVLEKSLNERMKLVEQEVAYAEKQLALQPDNVEYQKALLEAQYRKADLEEEIVGFQSEQLINQQDLQKQVAEYNDLKKSGQLEAKALELDALAAAETNVGRRIELEQQAADVRYQGQLDALAGQMEFFDVESVEYQNLMNEKLTLDATYHAEKEQRQRDAYDAEMQRQTSLLTHEQTMEEQRLTNSQRATNEAWSSFFQQEEIAQLKFDNEYERLQKQLENERLTADERKVIEDQLSAHKDKVRKYEEDQEQKKTNMMIGLGLGLAKDLGAIAGAGAKYQKALAIAETTMGAYQTISSVFKDPSVPTFLKPILAASYGASALAQVKSITSTPIPTSPFGGGGGGDRGGSAPSAPMVSLSTASGAQTATINGAQNSQDEPDSGPQRVYVVSSDIKNTEELDRKIDSQSSIG